MISNSKFYSFDIGVNGKHLFFLYLNLKTLNISTLF